MNVTATDESEARWQKTPVANLLRHRPSGNYYARIRVRGKLIWKSLETDRISVAKLSRNHAVGIQRKGARRQSGYRETRRQAYGSLRSGNGDSHAWMPTAWIWAGSASLLTRVA